MFLAALVAGLALSAGFSDVTGARAAAPSIGQHHDAQSVATTGQTPASTTSLKTVDTAKVRDCVDLVQFGAFTGNKLLLAMWDEAGRDVPTLRKNCEAIGRNTPKTLDGLSKQWKDIQKWRAAVAARPHVTKASVPKPASLPRNTTPPANPPSTHSGSCTGGYINVDGNCIPSPSYSPSAPAGASAQCRDGTYSYSAHRRGTCSSHGGVATWL